MTSCEELSPGSVAPNDDDDDDDCAHEVCPSISDGGTANDERSAASDESNDTEKEFSENEIDGGDVNEAEEIRANAERMLQWAQYQTSKQEKMVELFNNMPSPRSSATRSIGQCETRQSLVDEDSSPLGTDFANRLVLSEGNEMIECDDTPKEGKMGKLLNNLRTMIDPSLGSESDESGSCDGDSD